MLEETTKESGSSKRNMLKRLSGFVKRNIKATILRGDVTIPQKTDDERMTLLKQTFEKKVTSYKYFWLLSLLYHIKENGLEQPISIESMVKEIVVQAWMYVVEYKSEFTSSDQLPHIVNAINENNEPRTDMDEIRIVVNNDVSSYSDIRSMVVKLANNVPYRFLSPWITYSTALDVSKRSLKFENDCPYSVTKEEIRINPKWKTFFEKNTDSIQEYVKKELCNYLNIEYSDDKVDEESEWHFIDNVYFERASKFFLKHKCRVVMAEMGYYLEVNNEYIKLGDYQDGFDMWDGSICIKRPTIVSKANRIVHVYGKKVHEIGWIKEFDTFITFTNPSCEEYTITFNS